MYPGASGGRGDPHPVLGAAGARPRRLRGRRQGEQSLPHSGEREEEIRLNLKHIDNC